MLAGQGEGATELVELGCSLSHGKPACRGCQGWYKGYTEAVMRKLIERGVPQEKLPCGTLQEQMRIWEEDHGIQRLAVQGGWVKF